MLFYHNYFKLCSLFRHTHSHFKWFWRGLTWFLAEISKTWSQNFPFKIPIFTTFYTVSGIFRSILPCFGTIIGPNWGLPIFMHPNSSLSCILYESKGYVDLWGHAWSRAYENTGKCPIGGIFDQNEKKSMIPGPFFGLILSFGPIYW